MKRILVLACIILVACSSEKELPPPQVTVEKIGTRDVSNTAQYIATVTPINTIQLAPRVSGYLLEQTFPGGNDVSAGDLLYEIEPYEYIAEVDQREADLARAKAVLVNNELNYYRIKDLAEKDFASQAEADKAKAEFETAVADVKAAEAELFNAKLNLSYTKIYTPLDGRIGYSQFNVGDYISPESGILTTVVQLDPIYVVFSLNETALLGIHLDDSPYTQKELNDKFTAKVKFQNGDIYPIEGFIESMNNEIDPGTGSIMVRTTFDNPKGVLVPGQFVNVIIQKGKPRMSVVVPALSVLYDKQGYYVLVVNDENIVEARYIKEGVKTPEYVEVLSGVKAGERVVVEGLQKSKPGSPVNPVMSKHNEEEQE